MPGKRKPRSNGDGTRDPGWGAVMSTEHAIEVIFKLRGWHKTRYQYPCEDGGTGTARAWHKEDTGLWIKSCQGGRAFDVSAGPAGKRADLQRLRQGTVYQLSGDH
jgi:hypothetical protein